MCSVCVCVCGMENCIQIETIVSQAEILYMRIDHS